LCCTILQAGMGEKILYAKNQEVALPIIRQAIAECQLFDFATIHHYFEKRGVHLDQTRQAPTTKQEWEACLQNEEFSQQLAEQWIKHQQTIQALIWQALKQAFLSKNHMAKPMLLIDGLEHLLKVAFALLELPGIVTLKRLCTDFTQCPLAIVVTLTYPLYAPCNMSFKATYFLLKIMKHFFMQAYRPNAYSLEGYQLSVQVCYLTSMSWIFFFLPTISKKYEKAAKNQNEQLELLKGKDYQHHSGLSDECVKKIAEALSQVHDARAFLQLCKEAFHIPSFKGEEEKTLHERLLTYLQTE